MQLYQRVRIIAKEIAGSETKLATQIDVHQRTLNGYLKASREHNLWPLLPKILEIYPQINREWLFFGEGEMLRQSGAGMKAAAQPLRAVAHAPGSGENPTPHIDAVLLRQVIEILEEHLQTVKGRLSPAAKAEVISQLYELIVEQEEQAREPIQMMRLVMGALAKAANE